MIRLGFLVFLMMVAAGISGAAAQDIFLKHEKNEVDAAKKEAPSLFIKPKGATVAKKKGPVEEASPGFLETLRLKDKKLQAQTAAKIKAYADWNAKGRLPKTPEEYLAYAEWSRARTQAENYKRRDAMYAGARYEAPPIASVPLQTLDPAVQAPKAKSVFNPSGSGYKPPSKTF